MSSERPVNEIRDPAVIGIGPLDVHVFHEGDPHAYATLDAHGGRTPLRRNLGSGVRFAV